MMINASYFIWKAVTALSEHFSLFVMDVSLQPVDFYLCYEVFLLNPLVINLYYTAIQLC